VTSRNEKKVGHEADETRARGLARAAWRSRGGRSGVVLVAALAAMVFTPLLPFATSGSRAAAPDSVKTIGFLTGHGEPSIESELSAAAERVRRSYEVREVVLSRPDALAGVDVVVVAGSPDVPDSELYALDQFLMRGGDAVFLLDAAAMPAEGTQALISDANIFGFLDVYGITVNPDLVLDESCAEGAEWGSVATSAPYLCWPVVLEQGISAVHPAVRDFPRLRFSWTSSISIEVDRLGGARPEVLVRSSPRSWTVSAYSDIAPFPARTPPRLPEDADGNGGSFPLVVAVEGPLTSAFSGKRVIVQDESGARFVDPVGMLETGEPLRMVVVGNSLMFRDELSEQLPGNAGFLASLVDWVAEGADVPIASSGGPAPDGARMRYLAVLALVLVGASLVIARFGLARARGASRRPGGRSRGPTR